MAEVEVYNSEFTAEDFEKAIRAVPNIGENGNWFIGDTDTGIYASGFNVTNPAEVGQYFRISEVDENGLVVAVEAVDGVDDAWVLLADVTMEEDAKSYEMVFVEPQKKLRVVVDSLVADTDTNYSGFTVKLENEALSSYRVNIGPIYPFAIPRKTASVSVYDISAYYVNDVPYLEAYTFYNNDANNTKHYLYNSNKENYQGKMMVPKIMSFSQNTYGTFAAGTRYRIYGVKA